MGEQPMNSTKQAMPVLLGLIFSSTGCLPNRAYRTHLPPCPPDPKGGVPPTCSVQIVKSAIGQEATDIPVAFVEFDDVGQAYNLGQIKAAEDAIQAAQQKHGQVVTILYMHGWQNNASDDAGNVPGFRRLLQQFQPKLTGYGLVGVYFGWRGQTTNVAVAKYLTYWNRRDTATYIPGSNMTEALLRVSRATKGPNYNGDSKLVVVGHSFGGLALERTVAQYLTRRVVETPADHTFQPFADLLVFVNEAAAATEAIQLLTMFHNHVEENAKYPTIVSITSQGDLATKFVLPVGQGASLFKKSLRDYGPPYPPDPFGIPKQVSYYLRSATHIPELQSHLVGSSNEIRQAYADRGYTCASIRSGDKSVNYYVVPISGAKNTTPYWIMEMPVEIVPDHSNIFRVEFGELLQAFVIRQTVDKKPDIDNCSWDPQNLPDMRNMKSAIRVVK
jgi:pimeloyl-ACP methyl ester carboxylesterase